MICPILELGCSKNLIRIHQILLHDEDDPERNKKYLSVLSSREVYLPGDLLKDLCFLCFFVLHFSGSMLCPPPPNLGGRIKGGAGAGTLKGVGRGDTPSSQSPD